MNHSNKLKNYNRTTAHRVSMFKNMVESFEKHNHVTTTLAKSKHLKALISDGKEKITVVRVGKRVGDNAPVVKLMGERYINKLNNPKKNAKTNRKQTKK